MPRVRYADGAARAFEPYAEIAASGNGRALFYHDHEFGHRPMERYRMHCVQTARSALAKTVFVGDGVEGDASAAFIGDYNRSLVASHDGGMATNRSARAHFDGQALRVYNDRTARQSLAPAPGDHLYACRAGDYGVLEERRHDGQDLRSFPLGGIHLGREAVRRRPAPVDAYPRRARR